MKHQPRTDLNMKAHIASLINALSLLAMSAWAYLGATEPSLTALIPAGFGMVLLLCYPGVRSENKIIAHIAVILTLLILVALIMPLRGALAREDLMAMIRVGLMMATTLFAFVFFIKSFIDARKQREE
ncbi:MAG: hypothetical protein AAGB16_04195 [Pseudomonadota bacterium]